MKHKILSVIAMFIVATSLMGLTAPAASANQFPDDTGYPLTEDSANTLLSLPPTDEVCDGILNLAVQAVGVLKWGESLGIEGVIHEAKKFLWQLGTIYGTIGCGDLKNDVREVVAW